MAVSGNGIPHHRVVIIGAGFAGLGMAVRLRQAGETDFVVFDKESGVGGTWWVNRYPGCACDVESHLYSFSFAPNPGWRRMFAPGAEIQTYLQRCAERFGVTPHLRLGTGIRRMDWDDNAGLWHLLDEHGARYTANVVVAGMGALSVPHYPEIPGLERFQGRLFHSQQWDHSQPLDDERVAVIGTGASAIQFVPEIQPRVRHLDLYQRTPAWVLPRPDRPVSPRERNWFQRLPALQRAWRWGLYWMLEARVLAFAKFPGLMRLLQRSAERHLRRQVADPRLRRALTPDYLFGCKRILLSDTFYPAVTAPNVDLVTTGIREVGEHGIVSRDGRERPADTIILGTGFRAADPIPKGMIFGRRGVDLGVLWKDGPQAYKGTTVSGFPNLFMLLGPNTGLGHSSVVLMIESQIAYVVDALRRMGRAGLRAVDVKPEAQQAWNARLQRRLQGTVWNAGGCRSWYLHPVSGRNVTLWPGFTWQFRLHTRRFDLRAYRTRHRDADVAAPATRIAVSGEEW